MAELDWFNKPVEKSRDLILKEAFKLFLQKNVGKVTVPELERVTRLQRGAIFYHFKDKEAIFREVIEKYFFSSLNIFSPILPDGIYSIEEYWDKKNEHSAKIQCWFNKEEIPINPYSAFFHLAEQANLYIPAFRENMQKLLETNKTYWTQILLLKPKLAKSYIDAHCIGHLMDSLYLAQCYTAGYSEKGFSYGSDDITKLLIELFNTLQINEVT